jgi:predicted peptidase
MTWPFRILIASVTLSIITFSTACTTVEQQTNSQAELLRLAYTSHLDQAEREYFVYLPEGYAANPDKEWPVMLFLHGNGERGNGKDELDFVLTHGPLYEAWIQKQNLPFIIISPQLHMLGQDEQAPYIRSRTRSSIPQRLDVGTPPREATFPTDQPMSGTPAVEDISGVPVTLPAGWDLVEQDLLDMLERVSEEFRTDEQRVYITGLSYGGFGTWYMASRHPEKFAAMAPVVGWGHPQLVEPIAQHKVPVWAFAGGRDPVVPVQYFYPGLNKLEALGHNQVRFTTHEDMGHDAWRRVYRSQDLYEWLLEHSL